MKTEEMQKIWTDYTMHIDRSTTVNKSILKYMMQADFKKQVGYVKLRQEFKILLSCLIGVIFILAFPFRNDASYLTGMSVYGLIVIVSVYQMISTLAKIYRISSTSSVVEMQKQVDGLEKYKLIRRRTGYAIGPLGIIGILAMIKFEPSGIDSVIYLIFIAIIFTCSALYGYYSTKRQFGELRAKLKVLSDLEK